MFPSVKIEIVPLRRKISPARDLHVLFSLYRLFRKRQFDIIHLHTPKASLLGVLAARLARHKRIIFHLHGLVSLRLNKIEKGLIYFVERVPFRLSHQVLCVSNSLAQYCVNKSLVKEEKIRVIANGSINGIDFEKKFNPKLVSPKSRILRQELKLEDRFVVGYVGRMTGDKGLLDLLDVAQNLAKKVQDFTLLMVGPNEMAGDLRSHLESSLQGVAFRYVDRTENPENFLFLCDVFLFPSHREGFGLVLAEASAMKVPNVAYDIVGVRDAVKNGHTGILVDPGSIGGLTRAVMNYYQDSDLRRLHGNQGRRWVEASFDPEQIWCEQFQVYKQLMESGLGPDAH
jgi:glycosyltransferase involved in cell wall biosynthesis